LKKSALAGRRHTRPIPESIIIKPAMTIIDAAFRNTLGEYCRHHHVRQLALFGSQSKGTAGPESDIDLLIEFEQGQEPGLIGLAAMEAELSNLLGGRKVDLRTPNELSRHFREEVRRHALIQYAA
jgi:hypothetical protein